MPLQLHVPWSAVPSPSAPYWRIEPGGERQAFVIAGNYAAIDSTMAEFIVVPWKYEEAIAAKLRYSGWPVFIQKLLNRRYTPSRKHHYGVERIQHATVDCFLPRARVAYCAATISSSIQD